MSFWFLYIIHNVQGLVRARDVEHAEERLQEFFGEATRRNIHVEWINEEEWGGREALDAAGRPCGMINC